MAEPRLDAIDLFPSPPPRGRGAGVKGTATLQSAPLVLLPSLARAAENASSASGYFSVVASLLLILGGFVLVAWLVRRWMPQGAQAGLVKVVGATSVGPRERVVVVEVDNTWLVLGVGGGQVRSLHTMNKPRDEGKQG